jgi:hypothetical protein
VSRPAASGQFCDSSDIFSGYQPYHLKMALHSGALFSADDPHTVVRPEKKSRSKKSMSAKDQAAKRLLEQQVDDLVKEGSDESGSPKKKVCGPNRVMLFHTDT